MELNKRLIWLAGFTDGEGTITVFNHWDNSTKFRRYCAQYSIVNTNPLLINEVQKILTELGVTSYLMVRITQKKEHSDAMQLTVRKITHLIKLLKAINPYLIGKKAQGEIVLRFCESRINREGTGTNQYSPYNGKEKELSEECYKLNKKGQFKVSETRRQTPVGEDIVRAESKDSELALV